jgi:hypothetical protein
MNYLYKKKTWKGKMIKNMLKRRKESDTYLATDSRYCRSPQIAMKVDKLCSFQPAESYTLYPLSLRSADSGDIYCQ